VLCTAVCCALCSAAAVCCALRCAALLYCVLCSVVLCACALMYCVLCCSALLCAVCYELCAKPHNHIRSISVFSLQIESQFSKETSPSSTILQYCCGSISSHAVMKYRLRLTKSLSLVHQRHSKTFDAKKIIALYSYVRNYVETVDELYRRERS
jgi:hypothetical protein